MLHIDSHFCVAPTGVVVIAMVWCIGPQAVSCIVLCACQVLVNVVLLVVVDLCQPLSCMPVDEHVVFIQHLLPLCELLVIETACSFPCSQSCITLPSAKLWPLPGASGVLVFLHTYKTVTRW